MNKHWRPPKSFKVWHLLKNQVLFEKDSVWKYWSFADWKAAHCKRIL